MKKLNEQEEIISKIDKKITDIIRTLKDNTFSNQETRKDFAHLIVKLCLSRDPRSRVAIKKLGDAFTDIGEELLKMYDKDGQKVQEVRITKWRSIFKENIISEFESIFKNLFRKHSAKESAGILKIALADSMPDEEYMKNFMRIFK